MKLSRKFIIGICILAFSVPAVLFACSFFVSYIYAPEEYNGYEPVISEDHIWDGELHVVQPGWGFRYLYPTYRSLAGKTPLPKERETFEAYLILHDNGQYDLPNKTAVQA